jgi:hypothetical protein
MVQLDPATLNARIDVALRELGVAQLELQKVLDELLPVVRADKTMVSTLLRDVLSKVTTAQAALADLRSEQ